jgi:hypothetical protein
MFEQWRDYYLFLKKIEGRGGGGLYNWQASWHSFKARRRFSYLFAKSEGVSRKLFVCGLYYILILNKVWERFCKSGSNVDILSKLEVFSIKPERCLEEMLFLQSLRGLCKITRAWVELATNFNNVGGVFVKLWSLMGVGSENPPPPPPQASCLVKILVCMQESGILQWCDHLTSQKVCYFRSNFFHLFYLVIQADLVRFCCVRMQHYLVWSLGMFLHNLIGYKKFSVNLEFLVEIWNFKVKSWPFWGDV